MKKGRKPTFLTGENALSGFPRNIEKERR